MSPAHANIDRSRRVGLTLGSLYVLLGSVAGGVGTLVTVKVTTAAQIEKHDDKLAGHEKSLDDHGKRINVLERDTTDRFARIETKLDEVLKRLK
jgi:hypothetical protein